jgi:hypothetical protein
VWDGHSCPSLLTLILILTLLLTLILILTGKGPASAVPQTEESLFPKRDVIPNRAPSLVRNLLFFSGCPVLVSAPFAETGRGF